MHENADCKARVLSTKHLNFPLFIGKACTIPRIQLHFSKRWFFHFFRTLDNVLVTTQWLGSFKPSSADAAKTIFGKQNCLLFSNILIWKSLAQKMLKTCLHIYISQPIWKETTTFAEKPFHCSCSLRDKLTQGSLHDTFKSFCATIKLMRDQAKVYLSPVLKLIPKLHLLF